MNKLFFIIVIFLTTACLSASTSSNSSVSVDNSDQIKILYQRAEEYIDKNNFKKSLKVLKGLTKREDLSGFRADIYNLLGFSYRKLNKPDLDKSFAAYMMAIEIDPNHIGAHAYLGELYLMLDNKNKATEMLVKLESLTDKSSKEYIDLKKAIDLY
jgi:tetratricopeptide (TPR) repeat protein